MVVPSRTPTCGMALAQQSAVLRVVCRVLPPIAGAARTLPALRSVQGGAVRRWRANAAAGLDQAPAEADPFLDLDDDEPLHAPLSGAAASEPPPADPQPSATASANRTGAFQRLPMVSPSRELIDSALRRASRVPPNKKLKNEAAKAKNRAARSLDTLMKELAAPLGAYQRGFPPTHRLHPFEQALLELTLGPETYDRTLLKLNGLKKASVEVAKGYAARASKAANKKEALALQAEGFQRVEAVFAKGAAAVDELKDVAKSLRRLPVVEPELPTVALVGSPNVGKSSLVQLLSSGLPEVRDYPFTTRSIKMGHFYVDGRRHQVTDTPGLLARPDADRNAMERLTLASLQYLPTAVLFVADLTAQCGTSLADQWKIREELRARFPTKPWLDVLSKADLLEEEIDEANDLMAARQAQQEGSSAGAVEPCFAPDAQPNVAADAIQFVAALPGALRVSSLTGSGVDELKAAMLCMLEAADLRREGVEVWENEEEEDEAASAELAPVAYYD